MLVKGTWRGTDASREFFTRDGREVICPHDAIHSDSESIRPFPLPRRRAPMRCSAIAGAVDRKGDP